MGEGLSFRGGGGRASPSSGGGGAGLEASEGGGAEESCRGGGGQGRGTGGGVVGKAKISPNFGGSAGFFHFWAIFLSFEWANLTNFLPGGGMQQ